LVKVRELIGNEQQIAFVVGNIKSDEVAILGFAPNQTIEQSLSVLINVTYWFIQ